MDMGLPTINTWDDIIVLGTPATKIRRNTDGSHWSAYNQVFGEAIVLGISAEKSNHDYNYETNFEIWRKIIILSAKTF